MSSIVAALAGERARSLLGKLAAIALAVAVFCAVAAFGLWGPGRQSSRPGGARPAPPPSAATVAQAPVPPPTFDGALFAYRASGELVLVKGNKILARTSADSGKSSSDVRFTGDGRFAFVVSSGFDSAKLTALDSKNGSIWAMPHPDGFSAPGPGSAVLGARWHGDPVNRQVELIQLDLAQRSPAPTVSRIVQLPGSPHAEYESRGRSLAVKDSHDGSAVIAVQGGVSNAIYEYFYLFRPDGSVQYLGSGATNGNTTAANTGSTISPDGKWFAYYSWGHVSAFCGIPYDNLYSLETPGSPPITVGGPDVPNRGIPIMRRWTSDGKLRVVFESDCARSNSDSLQPRPETPSDHLPGVWEWEPGTDRWAQVSPVEPAWPDREWPLPNGDSVVHNKDGLFVRHDGQLALIAKGSISDVTVAPQ